MATRAKFRVIEKTEMSGGGFKIKLNPIYTGSEEDKAFFKYTPFGEITLGLINSDVATQFKVDSYFYVDFTEVQEDK